jgi:hypothetical protein
MKCMALLRASICPVSGTVTMTIVRSNENFTTMEANKSVIKFRSRLEQLNDSHVDLTKKYEEQQRIIVNEMVAISSEFTESMAHLGQVISKLDVLVRLWVGLSGFRPFSEVRKVKPTSNNSVFQ